MAAWLYFPLPHHLRGTLSLTISSSHSLEGDVGLVLVIIPSWSVELQWLSGRTLPTHHLRDTLSLTLLLRVTFWKVNWRSFSYYFMFVAWSNFNDYSPPPSPSRHTFPRFISQCGIQDVNFGLFFMLLHVCGLEEL